MTRTISLITGIIGAALLFAVPAYADDWGADRAQQQAQQAAPIVSERVSESQALVALRIRSQAQNRKHGLGDFAQKTTDYRDANERVVQPQSVIAQQVRSQGLNEKYGLGEFVTDNGYVDAHERAVPPVSPTQVVSATSTDDDVQWPQIGIGLGVGIALAFGLMLALRATRQRPLAH